MFWLQGKDWDEIIEDDFIIIMPNPRFNQLQKPLKLPFELYPYMHNQVITDLQLWCYYRDMQLMPWTIKKGKVKSDDIKIIEMMALMTSDVERRKQKTAEMQAKSQQEFYSSQKTNRYF